MSATAFRVTPKHDPLTVTGDEISKATQISHPSAPPSANSGLPRPSLTASSPMRASGFP